MSKLLGVLLALIALGAFPAMVGAQGTEPAGGGDTISSGNAQNAEVEQEASGGNAGNQAGVAQQNAGGDAIVEIDQSQSFSGGGTSGRGAGEGDEGEGNGEGEDEGEGNGEGEDEGEGNGEGEGSGEGEDGTDSNTSTASCAQTTLGLAGGEALALAGADAWLSSESARSCE